MFRSVQRYACIVVGLSIFLAVSHLHAQTPIVEEPNYKPTLTFDVATIRQAPPPDANFHVSVSSPPHSSRFEVTNLPMKALLQIAYGFDAPVVGAPIGRRALSTKFRHAQTRRPMPSSPRLLTMRFGWEKRNALRVLLTERLNLKTHLETQARNICE